MDPAQREGTLHPALHRLERRGWIAAEWGLSENSGRTKYCTLTAKGRKRLASELTVWRSYSDAIEKALSEETG
jgi:DNA-binding PadR family transcriptional regulator